MVSEGPVLGREVTLGCVQLPARAVREAGRSLAEVERGVRDAAERGADLVILPECSWPGYVIGRRWREWWSVDQQQQVLDAWSGLARELGVVFVAGIALAEEGALHNCACVWDRDGSLRGQVNKRFLWDFDNDWFRAGRESTVVETSLGRLGVFVCADGRMPEVARSLALSGAEILLDPTAWVTSGDDPSSWTNPQYEFMMPTRARENGLWLAAANKVGIEGDAVAYCGRSCLIDDTGRHVASAPPDRPAVLVATARLHPAQLPASRAPQDYGILIRPTSAVLATHRRGDIGATSTRLVVDALRRPPDAADAEFLDSLGSGLLVSRRMNSPRLPRGYTLVGDETGARLVDPGGDRMVWPAGESFSTTGIAAPLAETAAGLVAVLLGEDALGPEWPRVLMLAGAQVLVWFAPPRLAEAVVGEITRTRAAENRVYVVSSHVAEDGWPRVHIYDPDGAPIASSGTTSRYVAAVIRPGETAVKEMAPGTDVVLGRQPESYQSLTS